MIANILVITITGFNLAALWHIMRGLRHAQPAVPQSFPWKWALVFAGVLLAGSLSPLGSLNKFYMFIGLLSAIIVGANARSLSLSKWLAIGLAVWLAADSLRLIPTADATVSSGETFGPLRRPYALEHPNIIASWLLLLPFGWWTLIGILLTQSRAALLGLLVLIGIRYVPTQYRGWSVLIGLALFGLATLARPGTMLARLDYWQEGGRLFLARPLTGWGTGSYYTSLNNPAAGEMNATVNHQRTNQHTAHNALITVATENGLMGLIPLVMLIIGVVNVARTSTHPARWSLLAFAVQQLFDDQWLHPVAVLLLGLAVGVCLANQKQAA